MGPLLRTPHRIFRIQPLSVSALQFSRTPLYRIYQPRQFATISMTDAETPQKAAEETPFKTIKEGKATVLVPDGAKVGEETSDVQQVFYNPIQQYNRDLSTLAIKTYGEEVIAQELERRATAKQQKKSKKRKRDDQNGEAAAAEAAPEPVEQPTGEGEQPVKQPAFRMLDALSASGLRALRYAHELPFVTSIVANDLSASAAESIKQNVEHNGVGHLVSVSNDDALAVMYRTIADNLTQKMTPGQSITSHKFDVIDLDPYGTAAPFLDAAIQAVRDDGGLLCVTCTDSAVWAGHSYSEKTFSLYGGTPIKGLHSHEAGLRLILNAIATSAARYGLAIEPQLSLSIDFYTKVFVKIVKSPQTVKFLGAKTMVVYSCDSGCSAWQTQYLMKSKAANNKKGNGAFYKHVMALGPTADRFCQHCGSKMHINGPMYGGQIHSADFINKLLAQIPKASPEVYGTLPRLEGMLQTALEELIPIPPETANVDPRDAKRAEIDHTPFYFIPGKLASVLSCATPGDDMIRGALKHLGYYAARSHCRAGSIKTDAPWSTIWWIMTEWIRQKAPIKVSKYNEKMASYKILHDAGLLSESTENETNVEAAATVDTAMDDIEPQAAEAPKTEDAAPKESEGISELELRKTLVFNDALAKLARQGAPTKKVVRYQMNPRANWGPLSKAAKN